MKVKLRMSDGIEQIQHINPNNFDKLKEKYGDRLKDGEENK